MLPGFRGQFRTWQQRVSLQALLVGDGGSEGQGGLKASGILPTLDEAEARDPGLCL